MEEEIQAVTSPEREAMLEDAENKRNDGSNSNRMEINILPWEECGIEENSQRSIGGYLHTREPGEPVVRTSVMKLKKTLRDLLGYRHTFKTTRLSVMNFGYEIEVNSREPDEVPSTPESYGACEENINNEKIENKECKVTENQGEQPWIKEAEVIIIPKLYEAATNGDIEPFKNLGDEEENLIKNAVSSQKNTVLHVAASFGHEEIVRLICERYPSLSREQNCSGDTPLHLAARYGHLSVVRVFIKVAENETNTYTTKFGDVDLSIINNNGNTALHDAARNRHKKVLQELLTNKKKSLAYLNNKKDESPCYLAAEAGYVDVVKDMFPLQEFAPYEKTSLHAAIVGRHAALVEMITKEQPAIVHFRDKNEKTPLHYAAFLGFFEAVSCLLQNDTSSAYKMDTNGFFPIHWAASKGHANVIQYLIERCPDSRELLTIEGKNVLHVAAENGKEKVVTSVLKTPKLEKLINESDQNGNTPLHLAASHCHPKIVSILTRDERVKKNLLNNKGMTPLDVAVNTKTTAWFQKGLTITALKVINAPRARNKNIFQEGFGEGNINIKSKSVDPLQEKQERTSQGTSLVLPNVQILESFKDRVNTLLLVATLIATMAFTAGFTIPGGNTSDDPNPGKAILLSKIWFQTFVICNTIAMYSAIIVVVALTWAQLGEINLIKFILKWVTPLLVLSLTTISIAFTAGVSLVVRELHWLAIVVYILSFIFLLGALFLFVPLCLPYDSKRPIIRSISYCVFRILIFTTKSDHEDEDENMEM